MRLPQHPPPLHGDALGHYLNILREEPAKAQEIDAFIADVNRRYLHWDELRHREMPGGLSPEEIWTMIRLERGAPRRAPLADPAGRPFVYRVTQRLSRTLHEVDRLSGTELLVPPDGRLDAGMRDRVLINSLMEEAISTSQIEGAITTIERGKDMLRSGRRPVNRSEQMIVNGYRTMSLIRERLDRPLDLGLLHEIQAMITESTLGDPQAAGRLRTTDDVVVEDARDGNVIFTPPPARLLPGEIDRLIAYANAPAADDRDFVHPLARASILHFWLAYLHPYADGNGRTARALFYWYMLRQGYFLFQFLTVSRVIHRSRMQYYRSFLHSESDENDLTYFLVYQANAVQKAISDLHAQINRLREEQRQMAMVHRARKLNSRQRALLSHALRHPAQRYTFESHQASHGISYQTSRTDLLGLARRGFLKELGGRPRTFVPAEQLQRLLQP